MSDKYSTAILKNEKNCIYCVSKISLDSSLFRYPNDHKLLADTFFAPDPQLALYNPLVGELPIVYAPSESQKRQKTLKLRVKNNNDIENTVELIDRVCNVCHHNLPHNFFEEDYKILSIAGAKGVGKTCYIASMLKDMSDHFHKLGIQFEFEGDSLDRYIRLYEPFIESGKPPMATDMLAYLPPLLVKLTAKEKDETKVIYFAIHDISGEAFNNDQLTTLGKYIPNSHAVILLVDPFQEPSIRNEIKMHPTLRDSLEFKNIEKFTSVSNILMKLTQFIKRHSDLEDGKIKSHCALCFSKLDAIHELDDHHHLSSILDNSVYDKDIDCRSANDKELVQLYNYINQTIHENHKNMEAVLEKWSLGGVLNSLASNFKSYRIFAVSSSINFNVATAIQAKHVSDPILWFCEEFMLLPSQITKEENQIVKILATLVFLFIAATLGLLFFNPNVKSTLDQDQNLATEDQNVGVEALIKQLGDEKLDIEFKSLKNKKGKISKYEISVKDYVKCIRDQKCTPHKYQHPDCVYPQYLKDPKRISAKNHPSMNCLNIEEALEFLKYAQGEIDHDIIIPTKTIWMNAAIPSNPRDKYPWGKADISCKYANISKCEEKKSSYKCFGESDDGVCNLIGNLSEFVKRDDGSYILKGGDYTSSDSIKASDDEDYSTTTLEIVGLRLAKPR
jgi:hypothetical protein